MQKFLGRFIGLVFFWLLFFAFNRLLFLLYYQHLINADGIRISEAAAVFRHAIQLDMSTAAYLLFLPFILGCIQLFKKADFLNTIMAIYHFAVILLYSIINAAELGLYGEWKTKLSYKALAYLRQPAEIFNTVSTLEFLLLIGLVAGQTALFYFLYNKFFKHNGKINARPVFKIGAAAFGAALLFIAARGGWMAIPVSISSVYFSQHQLLNAAAVNPLYNISVNLLNTRSFSKENIFKTMPDDVAMQIVQRLHTVPVDTTISILNSKTPNLVVILLESWSADLIESLGGEAGITPNFKELEKEGLLFTNFYASANRSQQAMGSLYGGLPGIPITTITNHPEKYHALPSLSVDLKNEGYFSSFYFGGQLNYGNILSYLIHNKIDKIVEGKDLPKTMLRGKLGVHDGILLPYFAAELDHHPEPFFSTVFTLSSHAPYDFPMEHHIQWPTIEKAHVNSAYYADSALGNFFEIARTKKWFDNTLFIIVADHSKSTYRNHPLESFEYHRIPLLLLGPVLKDAYKGQQANILSGNTDLPATLLHQLGLPSLEYRWSKNLFNPYSQQFAFFELNEGLGWMRPEGYFVWDKFADRYYKKNITEDKKDEIILEGKAYLQVLFEEFINY